MSRRSLSLAKVYALLEPGPVVLLTTEGRTGTNVMTMSWHTMMDFEPPLIGCVVSNGDYSFTALKATRECVINIPTVELAEQVVGCGNTHAPTVDKFERYRLTKAQASEVDAPLIAECYANLECRVVDTKLVNKYSFFVLEVVKAWLNRSIKHPRTIHHMGNGVFMVAGEIIKLASHMK